MYIPLTKPFWGKREEQAAVEAIRNSTGTGGGPYNRKLAAELRKLTGSKFAFPVTSCTHGLELAMAVLDLKPGDEVIVPSFTMTSTANCVVLAGATPVFADIEDTYYCLDPADVLRKITKKTRGVIFVSYAGMAGPTSPRGAGLRGVKEICKKNKLFLVEDAAHAIGALYKKKPLGTFGDIGVYSFHGTKNISCGEGGAVLTDNKELAEKMEIYRANGTNRAAFLKGDVDKYSWVGKGTSYFLSDILSSIIISQIGQIRQISIKRNQIASFYTKHLQKYQFLIKLPTVPKGSVPNWHIYAICFKKSGHRDIFIKKMREKGIEVSSHYVPLHSSKMGKNILGDKGAQGNMGELPVTDRVAESLVRLPIYPGLTKKELTYIVSSAQKVLKTL